MAGAVLAGQRALPGILCGADGARAGCGPCVRQFAHPIGGDEYHRDARHAEFYIVEQCPYCVTCCEQGLEMAAHLLDEHGIDRSR